MTDMLPEPPYLYDDPRLLYDEQCLFYDGQGYDEVCLAGPPVVVVRPFGGAGSGSAGRRRYDKKLPYINLFIQAQLLQVNDEFFEEKAKVIRFTGEDSPISIFINNIQLDTRHPYVSGEIKKLIDESPGDLTASVKFLENIREKSDEEVIAQNLKSNLTDVKVEIVEPFTDIKVKAELVKEEPEVSLTVTLIKKGDT